MRLYTMRYVDGTIGLLHTLEQVHWFGRYPAEPTRMLFAYTPLAPGRTHVQPIYADGRVDVRESTSSPRVVFYVTVMFWHIARGQDIAAANTRYAQIKTRS